MTMMPRVVMMALVALLSVALATVAAAGDAASNVLVLTDDNFEHLTQASSGATTGDWLVEFYAPWCGHCRKLTPIYEEVADELKGVVNVAKVDATEESDLRSRFEVRGFPTIMLFHQGKMVKYSGPRTVEELTRFARSGYKTLASQPVPKPWSLSATVSHHAELIKQDFISLYLTKKNVLLITFAVGALAGLILGLSCACCSSRSAPAAKTKTS